MADPQGTSDEWVDLETLSVLSGIDHGHLSQMETGDALPSVHHQKGLEAHAPPGQVEHLTRHEPPSPEYRTTRSGRVPEGYALMGLIPADDLRDGDMLAYKPSGVRSGTHWVRVDGDPVREGLMRRAVLGEVEQIIPANKPVRAARPVTRGPDD